jgi:hypothetical protein
MPQTTINLVLTSFTVSLSAISVSNARLQHGHDLSALASRTNFWKTRSKAGASSDFLHVVDEEARA